MAIAGGAAFGNAVLETIGKRLGNWIADQVEKRLKQGGVQIRADDGAAVNVDPANPAGARDLYTKLIEKTASRGGTVIILFPW